MSEAELHWLKQRLLGGKLAKAEQGDLRFRPPVGLVYDPTGKMVLDPDEEVQAAVRLAFDLFEEYGSALAVVKHFRTHQLRFPDRLWQRTRKSELVWEPLRCGRVLSLLHNPCYAGAYVYGLSPRPAASLCREKSPASKDVPVKLNVRTGQLCCLMLILATSLGTSFYTINRFWMTIERGDQKNIVERYVKVHPCFKGSFCVESVGVG
jgi:hypothetical protein